VQAGSGRARMKKKKSKISERQSRAANRNRFFADINVMLRELNLDLRVSHMLPAFQDFLYQGKIIAPKLMPSDGVSKSSDAFLDIKTILNKVLESNFIWFETLGREVSAKEYLTIYFEIIKITNTYLKGTYSISEQDLAVLRRFKQEFEEKFDKVKKDIGSFASLATWFFSDIKKNIFWLDYEFDTLLSDKPSPIFNWIYRNREVESKKFLKDRFNRIAYRFYEIKHEKNPDRMIALPLRAIVRQNEELDIYIQDHVYTRLIQRLDTIEEVRIIIELVKSLKEFEVETNKFGARMIVYKFIGKRLGYFTYKIINNDILLTTFLYLTHDHTPEGEKLNELTGLSKSDKKYLQIDKLSAFSTSDVKNNPELLGLFEQAGCGHLFDDDFKPLFEKRKEKTMANFVLQYLNKQ
jgi:hypothetical protein